MAGYGEIVKPLDECILYTEARASQPVYSGKMAMMVTYKVTAGGSAVEETIFPGTPQEMVTVYYDKGGKLALTHYCMLQNRPEMILASTSKNELNLQFDPACGIDPKIEAHMNSVKITFKGKNRMTQDWAFFDEGERQQSTPFDLTRKKF